MTGSNFMAHFCVLDEKILISCPSGHATLPDIKQFNALNQKVRHQGIPKETSYVQIENYHHLQGATIEEARNDYPKN
jgi:hypothetical protein